MPSGLTAGDGIAEASADAAAEAEPEAEDEEDDDVDVVLDARLVSRREDGVGSAGRKDMKNGVASPLKGKEFESVVLPRNDCSWSLGGLGEGEKREFVKESRARRSCRW